MSSSRIVDKAATEQPRREMKMENIPAKFELSQEQLQKIMPLLSAQKASVFHPLLVKAMREFEINTPKRAAAFIAQLAHESGQLYYMEEIADGSAYEGREDLGNVFPGDGKKFKGRGPIQLTGRANYRAFGKELGVDLENEPKLAASPQLGFRIAGCFWRRKGLNPLADSGDFKTITRKINGGDRGMQDRIKFHIVAKEVLGDE